MAAILSSDDDFNIYHLFAASSVIAYTAVPEVNWLMVLDVQTMVFSVKTAGELVIQLCKYLGNRQLNTYNIAISAMGAEIAKVSDLNKLTAKIDHHIKGTVFSHIFVKLQLIFITFCWKGMWSCRW